MTRETSAGVGVGRWLAPLEDADLAARSAASFLGLVARETGGLPMFAAQRVFELFAQLLILGCKFTVVFLELSNDSIALQASAAKHGQVRHDTAHRKPAG